MMTQRAMAESLSGTAGMSTFSGGAYPARLWTAFMAGALQGTEVLEFPEPANLGEQVNPAPTRTAAPPRVHISASRAGRDRFGGYFAVRSADPHVLHGDVLKRQIVGELKVRF